MENKGDIPSIAGDSPPVLCCPPNRIMPVNISPVSEKPAIKLKRGTAFKAREVIVEPDFERQLLVVVTSYQVWE
jgi:hypothetical protein